MVSEWKDKRQSGRQVSQRADRHEPHNCRFQGTAEGIGEIQWKDGKEDSLLDSKSPFWMEIREIIADGRPGKSDPLSGCYEMRLPKALFEDNPKSIMINWIDVYR